MKLKNIKQSSVTLMAVITISKLFGMLREIVLANYFGTSNVSDAYLIASSVPTLLFYFIGQSLSTAYIPMYSKIREKKGEKEAQTFSNNLLNIVLIIATVIVLLLLLFPNIVVKIFAAGFDSPTSEIASRLIRISAPSIYIMVAVYICTGYLQANKSFLAPAAVSLPRNLIVVVSIAFAASFGTDYLGWGLLASYLLEFMFLIPFVISKGYRYKPIAEFKDPHIKETFYMIVPILIGIGVNQLNKIIDKSIASTIVEGGISALSYASIIDVAISDILVTGIITILFVDCAQLVAKGDTEKVKSKISSTINEIGRAHV